MVTANCGQTLCKTIAYNHVYTYGMHKLLYLRIYSSTCRWEEMGILKSQFLANKREDGLIDHLILQMQSQWRTLAFGDIVDIMFLTNLQGMSKQRTLGGICLLYLFEDSNIHLLPETGNRRHTCRMSLLH